MKAALRWPVAKNQFDKLSKPAPSPFAKSLSTRRPQLDKFNEDIKSGSTYWLAEFKVKKVSRSKLVLERKTDKYKDVEI